MNRGRWRALTMIFLLGYALFLIYLGFQGFVMHRVIPAQYLGFLLLAGWLAGLRGYNIWAGGPLDPRKDPPLIPKDAGDRIRHGDDHR